eukprot:6113226-Lingulodinium_polyedra.AAC.1
MADERCAGCIGAVVSHRGPADPTCVCWYIASGTTGVSGTATRPWGVRDVWRFGRTVCARPPARRR